MDKGKIHMIDTTVKNRAVQEEKSLVIFENEEFGKLTVLDRDGEPWFVAKDIADILGYSETSSMTKRLDDDEKVTMPFRSNPSNVTQKIIINESGLYEAIFGSQMPKAKDFKRWIKREVLPSIRRTGTYTSNTTKSEKDTFELQLMGVKYCADMLHYSEPSKLQMVYAVHEYHGVPTVALPMYIEKVRVTFSAKDLLAKNNCGISPIAFNRLMIASGLLEDKERTS
jgi:prophage antirepressor-like protein